MELKEVVNTILQGNIYTPEDELERAMLIGLHSADVVSKKSKDKKEMFKINEYVTHNENGDIHYFNVNKQGAESVVELKISGSGFSYQTRPVATMEQGK